MDPYQAIEDDLFGDSGNEAGQGGVARHRGPAAMPLSRPTFGAPSRRLRHTLASSPSPAPPPSSAALAQAPSTDPASQTTDSVRESESQRRPDRRHRSRHPAQATPRRAPPVLPPLPPGAADPLHRPVPEDEDQYLLSLLGALDALHAEAERLERQDDGRGLADLLLRLEQYYVDCSSRATDWFVGVWRYGDTFDPEDQSRGQRSSYQTQVFGEILAVRVLFRQWRIRAGLAPPWHADESPSSFRRLVQLGYIKRKTTPVGQAPLRLVDTELESVLMVWHSCEIDAELERFLSRLLDRLAVLLTTRHPACVLNDSRYIQPFHGGAAASTASQDAVTEGGAGPGADGTRAAVGGEGAGGELAPETGVGTANQDGRPSRTAEDDELAMLSDLGGMDLDGDGDCMDLAPHATHGMDAGAAGMHQEQNEEEEQVLAGLPPTDPLNRLQGQERIQTLRRRQAANALALASAHTQEALRGFARQFAQHRRQGPKSTARYVANFDLLYRSQLRYWVLVRRLHFRHLLPEAAESTLAGEGAEATRPLTAHSLAAAQALQRMCLTGPEIRRLVVQKTEHVHSIMAEQIRQFIFAHQCAPDDPHWMAYAMPTSSRVPQSLLEKMHPEALNRLVEESGKAMSAWLNTPDPRRRGFREMVAIELWDKVLPPSVSFRRRFVTTLDDVEKHLPLLAGAMSRWPRLFQRNAHFVCVYQGRIQPPADGDIFDTLAVWLRLVAQHFAHTQLWSGHLAPFLKDERAVQVDAVQPMVFL